MFNDPRAFSILPVKHNYTNSGDTVFTGFFIPAYRMHLEFIDHRGVTNQEKAKAFYKEKLELKKDQPQAQLEYASEYCFTPEDALSRQGVNQFNQVLIAELLTNINILKQGEAISKGSLIKQGNDIRFIKDPKKHLQILEEPQLDPYTLEPIENLYVGGIDSIDAGVDDSTGQRDVSDFCIIILKRLHGLLQPKPVAYYKHRPNDIYDAYELALLLLQWYNCKAVLESTRITILTYFKENRALIHLMRRPKATYPDITKINVKQYGTPASENVILHYLKLIEKYVNHNCNTILFVEFLTQLQNYDYERKKKFDIIAALGMALLGDEELYARPVKMHTEEIIWEDIGYFVNEYGLKQLGVKPKQNTLSYEQFGAINIHQLIGNYRATL